jgi:MFS family permease
MNARPFYGWWIAAVGFLTLALTVGIPFYSLPFFYDYFQQDFGWSRALVTSGIGIATLVVLPIGGLILPKFTPRQLLIGGILLLSASLLCFATMRGSITIYYLGWASFMLGYLCAGPIPHQVLISEWFVRQRGVAMSFAYLGLGVGGAISEKYVALPLIHRIGWRGALATVGFALLGLIPLILLVVRNRPEDIGLQPRGERPLEQPTPLPRRAVLAKASFWLLALGSFASIGSIGSINQHMKLLFRDSGLSAEVTASTTFVMLLSSLIGRIVMGWLADRLPKKYVMVAAYLFISLPLPLLYFAARPGVPILFGWTFGFGLGADFMLIPLMAADLFGTHTLARVMGILLPADSIAQTICPLIVGTLYTRSGNYGSALVFVMSLALVGAISVSFLPARSTPANDLLPAKGLA